jgi:hypothetical protein
MDGQMATDCGQTLSGYSDPAAPPTPVRPSLEVPQHEPFLEVAVVVVVAVAAVGEELSLSGARAGRPQGS